MKKAIVILILLLLLTLSPPVFAESSQITSGLNYLASTQNPDGSWGSESSGVEILPSTVAVIETLQGLNQTNTTNYSNALLWLQVQGLETTDYLSERILALSVSGADLNMLLSYIDQVSFAWGGYASYEVNNLDTAQSLQALKKIGYTDQTVTNSAINYLLSTQNSDGGWGFSRDDPIGSNVFIAALVLQTLSSFKDTYPLQDLINKASAYLLTKQNPDGGFGSSPSTIYETALAVIALIESGQGQTQIQNGINYLTSTQLPNGSWENDPYSTALALRALASVKPNLSISSSDIIFSNPAPKTGDMITITSTIHNTGPSQAEGVSVQVFNNDPASGGVLVGETTIPFIAANGSSLATITWTIPAPMAYTIFIKADPLNTIAETNETDGEKILDRMQLKVVYQECKNRFQGDR